MTHSARGLVFFLLLPEAGHVLPMLPIVSRMEASGHRTVFLINRNIAVNLNERGIEAHAYCEQEEDFGSQQDFYAPVMTSKEIWEAEWGKQASRRPLANRIIDRIEEVAGEREISLFVLDKSLFHRLASVRTTLLRRYRLAIVSTAFLYDERDGVLNRPETMILCPGALLASPYRKLFSRVTYGEPSVAISRNSSIEALSAVPRSPIVVCSFGSQMSRFRDEVFRRIEFLSLLARQMPSLTFLTAFPDNWIATLPEAFRKPRNLVFEHPLRQSNALKFCSAFLSHGGLGGVKEAICAGVPMLCWPLGLDQWVNARSVEEAGLGKMIEEPSPSVRAIVDKLDLVMANQRIRHQLREYQELFLDRETMSIVANRLIELASAPPV